MRDQITPLYSTFSKPAKRWIVLIVAIAGFFSPLSANIYFPALGYIATELKISIELMNLTITAYLVCQGIVPFFIGGLADAYGRRPLYCSVFVVYFAANIGLALQDSYAALLILRILQSSGSSGEVPRYDLTLDVMFISAGTIALAISVVADIAAPHERGKYVGAALCGWVVLHVVDRCHGIKKLYMLFLRRIGVMIVAPEDLLANHM